MKKSLLIFLALSIPIISQLKCGILLNSNTGKAPPSLSFIKEVKKVLPTDKSSGVDRFIHVVVYFNSAMDPTSITSQTFVVRDAHLNFIQGTVTYNEEFKIARFKPLESLTANTTYTATISNAVKDLQGRSISSQFVWTFTTGENLEHVPLSIASTVPVSGEADFPLNSVILITSNMELDPTTVTTSTFKVSTSDSPVEGTVNYDSHVASFTPSVNFLPNTLYQVTISGMICNNGNGLASDYIWTFNTGSSTHQDDFTVLAREPAENSTLVSRSVLIRITFSEPPIPISVTSSTFFLTEPNGSTVEGTIVVDDKIATFTPRSELHSNTVYTVILTDGIKDIHLHGLTSKSWTFQTVANSDITRPTVFSTSPSKGETNIKLLPRIHVDFSKTMDSSSISTSNFLVKDSSQTAVTGSVSTSGSAAFFIPNAMLRHDTVYTVTLLPDIKDIQGITLANPYSWNFTTHIYPIAISSEPRNNSTDIAINSSINVTFSEEMDPVTITSSSFQLLAPGNSVVAGTISYSGHTAILTPTSSLTGNTNYQIKVSTDVKDLLDNQSLQQSFASQFKTKNVVSSQISYYTLNDGNNLFRSTVAFSKGNKGGTFSNTTNADGTVVLTISNAQADGESGFYIDFGALSGFNGFTIESTGSPITAKIWFDKDANSEYFTWTGSRYSSTGSDAYITGSSMNAGTNSIQGSTTFNSLTPGSGSYTLTQLKSGAAAGISGTTRVAIWVGTIVSGGGSASATINNLNF